MVACEAAGFTYIEVGSVGVACKYHTAVVVGDAVVGINVKVIKELDHVPVYVFGG